MSTVASSQSLLPNGTWSFDPVHSTASFAVKHMVVSTFRGSFEDVDASLVDGRLTGRVAVDSIQVKDENLAGHLKSPDFFDTAQFPEITFTSTSITGTPEDAVVEGDLTVRGTSQRVTGRGSVTGPTEDAFGGTRLGLTLETVVDRRAFGLNWNKELPKGGWALGHDVTLIVELEFVAQPAEA